MFVVAGSTGNTGRLVAESLLARQRPVTVLVRDDSKGAAWRAKGATVVVASLEDVDELTPVFSGSEGVYLLIPPNNKAGDFLFDRFRICDAMAAAVARSGVEHVVLLSSIGAEKAGGTGLIGANHHAERAIQRAAKNIVILRAAYFLENWATAVRGVRDSGVLYTFLRSGHRIPMVSTIDIGRLAAESLVDARPGKRILELSGPQEYSPEDIAQAFSDVLQKPVTVNERSLDNVQALFEGFGFSADVARQYREMYDALNSGFLTWGGGESFRGTVTAHDAVKRLLAS